MKNKKIVGGLLVAASLIFIAPKFVGNFAHEKLQEIESSINSLPFYSAEIIEYDQGWFTSKAKVNLRVKPGILNKITESFSRKTRKKLESFKKEGLTFDLDIAHGPVMLLDGLHMGLITSKSEFHPNLDNKDFKLTLDIDITSRINFFGTISNKLTNPAIDVVTDKKEEFHLSPLEYTLDVNSSNDHYSFKMNDVDLVIKPRYGATFNLTKFSMQGEGNKINDLLWTSEQTLDIDNMNVVKRDKKIFDLNNLSYFVNLQEAGNETLKLILKLASSDVTADAVKVNDINLNMTLSEFPIDAVTNMLAANEKMQELTFLGSGDKSSDRSDMRELLQDMMTHGTSILKNSPKFNIDQLSFKIGDGFFEGHATSKVQGDLITSIDDLKYLRKFILANMDVTFDKEMAIKFSEIGIMKKRRSASMSKEEIRDMATKQAAMLTGLATVEKYILEGKEKDTYKSSGEFKDNKLTINGKEISLPR